MMDYGYAGYVDGYYQNNAQEEEEEEWDREAYLDPMWEIQQKKVLIRFLSFGPKFRLSLHGVIRTWEKSEPQSLILKRIFKMVLSLYSY